MAARRVFGLNRWLLHLFMLTWVAVVIRIGEVLNLGLQCCTSLTCNSGPKVVTGLGCRRSNGDDPGGAPGQCLIECDEGSCSVINAAFEHEQNVLSADIEYVRDAAPMRLL